MSDSKRKNTIEDGNKAATKSKKIELPSTSEQMQIQHTSSLVKTNLLRLQVDEMLQEVGLGKIYASQKLTTWTRDFLDALSAQKESEYHASRCDLIGSFVNKTSTFPFVNIDVACAMPTDLFHSNKDLANFGYFDKRNRFVKYFAELLTSRELEHLVKSDSVGEAWFKGDPNKPMLIFEPNIVFKSCQICVRIIPTMSSTVFKLSHLSPQRNNIAKSLAAAATKGSQVEADVDLEAVGVSALTRSIEHNMSIAEDMAIIPQHRLLEKTFETFTSSRAACILVKVWLTQLSLRFALDGLDGHSAALLVAYLYQTKRVPASSPPLVVFQTLLHFIADTQLSSLVMSFRSSDLTPNTAPSSSSSSGAVNGGGVGGGVGTSGTSSGNTGVYSSMSSAFAVHLMHPLVGATQKDVVDYNCLWRVSRSTWQQLRSEAAVALRLLQSGRDCFHEIFLQPKTFFHRYDLCFHLPLPPTFFAAAGAASSAPSAGSGSPTPLQMTPLGLNSVVAALVDRALQPGSRVTSVSTCVIESELPPAQALLSQRSAHKWGRLVSETAPTGSGSPRGVSSIAIGVILDKENSHRRVDRGPDASAETALGPDGTEAKSDFATFWGPKCQLRRFQDGSIVEAVVWGDEASGPKAAKALPKGESIVEEILRYVLGRFLPALVGPGGAALTCPLAHLQHILPCSEPVAGSGSGTGTGELRVSKSRFSGDAETMTRVAVQALDKLRVALTGADGLVLAIENVSAVSPALRYTSLVPPMPHVGVPGIEGGRKAIKALSGQQVSLLCEPLLVVATLESSGKWPNDPEAKAKSVTALLVHISEQLKTKFEIRSVVSRGYLDVLLDGFIFRMCLDTNDDPSPPTRGLLTDDNGAGLWKCYSACADTIVAKDATAHRMPALRQRQLHHHAIRSVQQQHPSFAQAVRLLAAWVSGRSLSGLVSFETIELVVASVYKCPHGTREPSSASAGFVRSLRRLSSWDWANVPLVIDFSDEGVRPADHDALVSLFEAAKAEQGPGTGTGRPRVASMFIASYHSSSGGSYPAADSGPELPVLSLLVRSASQSHAECVRLLASTATPRQAGEGVAVVGHGHEHEESAAEVADAALAALMVDRSVSSTFNVVLKFSSAVVTPPEKVGAGPPFASFQAFANSTPNEYCVSKLIVRDHSLPNPVQAEIVDRLRARFGRMALFFWDCLQGREVGIVWRPRRFESQTLSILEARHKLPIELSLDSNDGGAFTVVNTTELMADILAACDGTIAEVQFL